MNLDVKRVQPKARFLEAVRFTGDNLEDIATWMVVGFGQTISKDRLGAKITGNGNDIPVFVGDWILKGVHGFFVVDDIRYNKEYEIVKPTPRGL